MRKYFNDESEARAFARAVTGYVRRETDDEAQDQPPRYFVDYSSRDTIKEGTELIAGESLYPEYKC